MKEWLEVIRDAAFFNLLVTNKKSIDIEESFDIKTMSGGISVHYETMFPVTKSTMPNPPSFIAVSDAYSHATTKSTKKNIVPHAEEPAPAQRAGNVAFIWGKSRGHGPFGTEGTSVTPYRDDGFPAVVIAVGLHKHYHYGKLSRKNQSYPAIKAEHLAAIWYDKDGDSHRSSGPSTISFENYKEFWVDGEFKGHRWTDYCLSWNPRESNATADDNALTTFLGNLNGTTNMFGDLFFSDEEDEVCYIADFA